MTRQWLPAMLVPLLLLLSACSASKEGGTEERTNEEEMRRLEEEFDPSEYNSRINSGPATRTQRPAPSVQEPIRLSHPPATELVQGFRVQLLASQSIDEASAEKEKAEEIFPEEWFYLVYDPPAYKIRAGNFPTRFEADRFLQTVKQSGFRDAWVVPDRIQKDPPPRPVPGDPEDAGDEPESR